MTSKGFLRSKDNIVIATNIVRSKGEFINTTTITIKVDKFVGRVKALRVKVNIFNK